MRNAEKKKKTEGREQKTELTEVGVRNVNACADDIVHNVKKKATRNL